MQKWLLLAGVVLGLVTVVLLNLYITDLESREQGIAFLRLKPDVSVRRGSVLEPDMVVVERLPQRFEGLARLVVRADRQSRELLRGRPINRDLEGGAPLLYDYFIDDARDRFASRIEPGQRAIAIPVGSASAVAYLIEPGSLVDVIGTFARPVSNGGSGAPRVATSADLVTRTILQAVEVLAVDRAVSRGGYLDLSENGFDSVTLQVSPEQAEILTFALGQVQGDLTLSLRNPEDEERAEMPVIDWTDLN